MRTLYKRYAEAFVMGALLAAALMGGGYYLFSSALLAVVLMAMILVEIYCEKKMIFAIDINLVAFGILSAAFLLVSIWAVDSGMALMGVVKFCPLFLFYIWVTGREEIREKMIGFLPLAGTLMTLFSFVMSHFSAYERWVLVAGRLAGFFQYPNTYAMFMLICFVIVVYRVDMAHPDWLDLLYGAVSIFGIYMSGSRTVFVLTGAAVLWMAVARWRGLRKNDSGKNGLEKNESEKNESEKNESEKKGLRKKGFMIAGSLLIAVAVAAALLAPELLERFRSISLGSSTFLGRMLYARDAIPVILSHPFGLGYYGYYFMQQSFQTGVYSVVNTHNELLQLCLDVGILPAIVMCAALGKTLFSKDTPERNRLVLALLFLHSLLDYDFQFLIMGIILILFLNVGEVKEHKAPVFTRGVVGLVGCGLIVFSVVCALSDMNYVKGDYRKAYNVYRLNTLAELSLLSDETEDEAARAQSIIERNKYVSVAYSARANAFFSSGNIAQFIKDKEKALDLAPYQYEEYEQYLQMLDHCADMYWSRGASEDAMYCVERAQDIPDRLEKVKEKTSSIAWKIKDRPQLELSESSIELLEKMKRKADAVKALDNTGAAKKLKDYGAK